MERHLDSGEQHRTLSLQWQLPLSHRERNSRGEQKNPLRVVIERLQRVHELLFGLLRRKGERFDERLKCGLVGFQLPGCLRRPGSRWLCPEFALELDNHPIRRFDDLPCDILKSAWWRERGEAPAKLLKLWARDVEQ